MKPNLRLVVGGSKDGKFVDWPEDFGWYNIPKINNRPLFYDPSNDPWFNETTTVSIETYRKVRLILNGTRHSIWVLSDIPESRINTPYFLNKIAKLLAPDWEGGTWECKYWPKKDTIVFSYNPFGDRWHVYLEMPSELLNMRKIMRAGGDILVGELLKTQMEMTFYKVERIPLENINKTAEIGQGHS